MSWDFCDAWKSVDDVQAYLRKSLSAVNTVLAEGRSFEGYQCLWYAIETPEGNRLAFLALVEKDQQGWYGYKAIDESEGPAYYRIPIHVWEAIKDAPPLSVSAGNWRRKVKPVH